ncbi:MAG TPA: DNA-directed RNA polymerase, subunit E'' [Thermoplasmatales archaeon]|nr:DNA-directed RNA polymerase, subunit E'' [Thermoplasmatales archaeon]
MRACRRCHILTNRNTCPYCGEPTSDHWHGYLIVLNPSESKIAEKMKIKMPGKYALKVR